jgi:hypothetical protein
MPRRRPAEVFVRRGPLRAGSCSPVQWLAASRGGCEGRPGEAAALPGRRVHELALRRQPGGRGRARRLARRHAPAGHRGREQPFGDGLRAPLARSVPAALVHAGARDRPLRACHAGRGARLAPVLSAGAAGHHVRDAQRAAHGDEGRRTAQSWTSPLGPGARLPSTTGWWQRWACARERPCSLAICLPCSTRR